MPGLFESACAGDPEELSSRSVRMLVIRWSAANMGHTSWTATVTEAFFRIFSSPANSRRMPAAFQ
jgi:hypothetical protein